MSDVEQARKHFFAALDYIDSSDFTNAELQLREALSFSPGNASILTNLAVVLLRQDKRAEARQFAEQAVSAKADNIEAMLVLADCYAKDDDKLSEALAVLQNVISLDPTIADAHNNIGLVLRKRGRLSDALNSLDRAIALEPGFPDAHSNRGSVLRDLKRYQDSLAAYDQALALSPDFAEAWLGRGNVFHDLRRYAEALAAYDKVLARHSDHAEAWLGRGNVFWALRRDDEAGSAYQRALTHKPDMFEASESLVLLLRSKGNIAEALAFARRALGEKETSETKALVASCLCSPLIHPGVGDLGDLGDLRELLLRALSEPWLRQSELAPAIASYLGLNQAIRDGMARATKAWPTLLRAGKLLDASELTKTAEDRLFRALLESAPVCEVALERFATGLRFNLLTAARSDPDGAVAEPVLTLYCALARQCFINNYVFAQSDAETEQAQALRDVLIAALTSGAEVPALLLVAVAAYVPLHTLPRAESLPDRPWPESVSAVLAQQVRAPMEEQRLRVSMQALTAIGEGVSTQVRSQYEENPYPQWVKAAPAGTPKSVDVFMRQRFPLSSFVELGKSDDLDILVAGCGTGQHPIDTVSRFKAAQVLAVDLSLSSLCYAQRQTRALGLNMIHFAQADIMNMSSIDRRFDVIESGGVLHHLADPFAGWRVLLSLLRPRGVMLLGLYSEFARRDVVAARSFISARGYSPDADGIRRCRQALFDCADGTPLKDVTLNTDFFSLSECRDLLFHVQEHRLTLPEIASFITENNLEFLGFELDPQASRNYARQFPGDIAMTDLSQWHRYEVENPHTFSRMYQFWVQRK